MVICPTETDAPFLIPGHHYLFKRAEGWQRYQIWSEIIAYRLGSLMGLDVPPAFLAVDEKRERVGVLVEMFYGYPDEKRPRRFVHASDLLRLKDLKQGRPHTIRQNLRFAKALNVDGAEEWWAKILAFDALIGNTDRHPQNWGFLFDYSPSFSRSWSLLEWLLYRFKRTGTWPKDARVRVSLAPAFDNATSLGYEILEEKLERMSQPARLERYVNKGTHHCDWSHPSGKGNRQHFNLCATYAREYPNVLFAMRGVTEWQEVDVRHILESCTTFDVRPKFTEARAEFVLALLSTRRKKLLEALEADNG